jgi:hypothetical protein
MAVDLRLLFFAQSMRCDRRLQSKPRGAVKRLLVHTLESILHRHAPLEQLLAVPYRAVRGASSFIPQTLLDA